MRAVVHGAAENEATAREVTLTELRERTAAVADRDTLAPASPEGAGWPGWRSASGAGGLAGSGRH
jgi:hypothetical protein